MNPEILSLVAEMRLDGATWVKIADTLTQRFKVNKLVTMRLAHGWSQRDAADEWCRRWPDDLKTFKNFSYWENWSNASGYQPSLSVLIRLANIYECAVVDLVADFPDYRHLDRAGIAEPVAYGMEQTVIGQLCPHGCSVLAYTKCDCPLDRPAQHRERLGDVERDALRTAVVNRHKTGDSKRAIAADLGVSYSLVRRLLREAAADPSADVTDARKNPHR